MKPALQLSALLTLLVLGSLSPQSGMAATPVQKLTLIYAGNLDGELEPCGCSKEGDMGGIRRHATLLQELRRQHPGLVLISSGGLLATDSTTDRIKNKYILRGIQTLGYDAIGLQARDLQFGPELLLTEPLPWVASNGMEQGFARSRLIRRKQLGLRFFSWMPPPDARLQKMQSRQLSRSQSIERLRQEIQQARRQGNLIVLSTAQTLAEIQTLMPLMDIDILLIKSAHEVYGPPQQLGHTLVLQPGSRGMRFGQIELEIDQQHRIQFYQHKVIPMPPSVAESAQLADWYDAYNEELKQDYLKRVELRKASDTGTSPYAGVDKCQGCHQKAYKNWQQSQHAHAFASLEKVSKAFDPNCIGCHTVGFEQPGGYLDEMLTEHLQNVQCESCHGAAGAHVTSAGKQATVNKGWSKEKICTQCHVGSHSPSFKLESYWSKIAH